MMVIGIKKQLLIALALLLTAGCASQMKNLPPLFSQHSASDVSIKRAHDLLIQGEYEQGLALYAESYRNHRGKDVHDKYVQACNEVTNAGDAAFQNSDFASAGTAYKALLTSRIPAEETSGSLLFDEDYLKKQVKTCSEKLTEKGLMQYRQENLDEAIVTWKKVLTFDPDNKTVIKAIETANRQLRILKSIKE